jgi:hypothetical protein
MCPSRNKLVVVRFEVFTAVTMKNVVFWDVALCRSCVNRRFGGKYRLHLQGRKIRKRGTSVSRWLQTELPVGNNQLYKIYTAPHPRRRRSAILKLLKRAVIEQSGFYSGAYVGMYQLTKASRKFF